MRRRLQFTYVVTDTLQPHGVCHTSRHWHHDMHTDSESNQPCIARRTGSQQAVSATVAESLSATVTCTGFSATHPKKKMFT